MAPIRAKTNKDTSPEPRGYHGVSAKVLSSSSSGGRLKGPSSRQASLGSSSKPPWLCSSTIETTVRGLSCTHCTNTGHGGRACKGETLRSYTGPEGLEGRPCEHFREFPFLLVQWLDPAGTFCVARILDEQSSVLRFYCVARNSMTNQKPNKRQRLARLQVKKRENQIQTDRFIERWHDSQQVPKGPQSCPKPLQGPKVVTLTAG